jgi:hypothetical protein
MSSSIPSNNVVDRSSTSSPEGTAPNSSNKVLFRRRSTNSVENEVDEAENQPKTYKTSSFDVASPTRIENHMEEHQSVVTAEDDSGSEDLEAGKREDKGNGVHKKHFLSKRTMIVFLVSSCLVIAVTVGLIFAFQDSETSPSQQQSTLDTTLPPTSQEQEDIFGAGSDQDDGDSPSINVPIVENKRPDTDSNHTNIPPIKDPTFDDVFNQTATLGDDKKNSNGGTEATTTQPPNKFEILEWPELMGMPAEQAKLWLQKQYGEDTYDIIIVPQNSPVTKDLRLDRIRLFVDDDGVIVEIPRTG